MIHMLSRSIAVFLNRRMPRWLPMFACLGTPLAAQVDYATPFTFTFLAGSPGEPGSADGTGTAAGFNQPYGLAIDSSGNVYLADKKNATIRKVTSAGVVTTLAGSTNTVGTANGTGSAAQFNQPSGVAVDSTGNVYVADTANNTIRKITSAGAVTTLAGTGGTSGSTDGTGPAGLFSSPYGVAVDGSGNVYVTDFVNDEIRKVTSAGVVTTIAGSPAAAGTTDGTGSAARFSQPLGIAVDSSGNLYVTDSGNNTIRKVTPAGAVTTIAGSPGIEGSSDGTGSKALFHGPRGIAIDATGNLFVADGENCTIRKITPAGVVTTLAGTPGSIANAAGTGAAALFDVPTGIAVSSTGTIYVSSFQGYVISAGTAAVVSAPLLTEQPASQTVAGGSTVVFHALATGAPSPTYQWYANGAPLTDYNGITGSASATLVISDANGAEAASYACTASNSQGSVQSGAATLAVVATSNPGRLINLSCRAQVGTGASQLIVGYVVGGLGTVGNLPLLVRASGPALAAFSVAGALPDPELTLNNSVGIVASNNGWNGDATVASTAAAVGAFPWSSPTSHDAALVEALPDGAYTAQVAGSSGDTGVALAEVYDATPAGTYALSSPRLINISARDQVGTGGNVLIAGFVIGGTTSKTVLIRGSGPALGAFAVTGTLPDPQLQLFQSNGSSSTLIQSNTGWAGDPQIAVAASSVQAFSWGSSATPDSAILVTLPPGAYTAQLSGASSDTGIGLIEVYEVE
jgi:sugar lactone lactonase YvrE